MPITKKTPVGDVVKDFYKSDAPQFKGKSKKKKREMAVAAALSAKDKKKMTKEELKELVKKSLEEITIETNPENLGAIQGIVDDKTTIKVVEAAKTPKYDDNPALRGNQENLPDSLQKGIIDAAKKRGVKSEAIAYMPDEEGEFERTDTGKKDPTEMSLSRLLQRLKDEEKQGELDI